jgi:hypothetical protein
MKTVLTFLLALPSVALAQSITYELPTVYQVAGHACWAAPERYAVTGFDADTSTYTGLVFATTSCATGGRGGGGTPYVYAGCATAVWDAVGNLVSHSIEWRLTGRSAPPASACLG